MRRALSVPTSTPVCALHIDLGIYPIAEAIDRKMLSYWWRIQTNEASIPYRVMETQTTYYGYTCMSTWSSNIQALCTKYSISDNSRNCSKGQWKYRVKRALRIYYDSIVIQEASAKSKFRGLVQAKTKIKQEEYIDELPKKMARLIFMSHCNMLPIKAHMPFKWTDNPKCRLCGEYDETLDHLVQACPRVTSTPYRRCPKANNYGQIQHRHSDPPTIRAAPEWSHGSTGTPLTYENNEIAIDLCDI